MKKNYRADIDGLRAIAILLVLFFHLRLPFAQAGFLGVDIFFVISGFLITTHLVKDLEDNSFSIWRFYTKRLRRIMPALLLVLLATSIAACIILLPIALNQYARSLFASLSFTANYYFLHFIQIGYFSTNAKVLPLLHTWSLSVEEQFYLSWPILLFSLFWLFKKPGLKLLIPCLFLASIALYTWNLNQHQWLFYSPLTRAFELLAGALLAIWNPKLPHKNFIDHGLSVIGLCLILFAGCLLIPNDFPGAWVSLPLIGAILLIYSKNGIANRLLSLKPLVFIGLISYSLYLWHWPIIAYVNYLAITIKPSITIAITAASIALATLTWQFVEKPMRYKFKMSFLNSLICYVLLPLMLSFCFLLFMIKHPYFGYNQMNRQARSAIRNGFYGSVPSKSLCYNDSGNESALGSTKNCLVGEKNANNIQVLLTGDSHAMAANGLVNQLLKAKNLTGYIATQPATPFFLGKNGVSQGELSDIQHRNQVIKKLIKQNHYQYVVIGGIWAGPYYQFKKDPKAFKKGMVKTIKFVIENHALPVVLLDAPPLFSVPDNCGFSRITLRRCNNSEHLVLKYMKNTRNVIHSLKKRFPTLAVIDPLPLICRNKKCYSQLNGVPLYFNTGANFYDSHLNYAGSTLLGKLYLKRFGNPL